MALRGSLGAYRLALKHDFNPEGTDFVWTYQMAPIFDFSSLAEAKKLKWIWRLGTINKIGNYSRRRTGWEYKMRSLCR